MPHKPFHYLDPYDPYDEIKKTYTSTPRHPRRTAVSRDPNVVSTPSVPYATPIAPSLRGTPTPTSSAITATPSGFVSTTGGVTSSPFRDTAYAGDLPGIASISPFRDTAFAGDLPGTFDLMNQITGLSGPERYPGLANLSGVGITDQQRAGYNAAVDAYMARLGADTGAGRGRGETGGGQVGLFSGGQAPSPATFSEIDINFAGAPDWWLAMLPDINNPISNYQTLTNLLIPMLSPEDQRTTASNLFQSAPEQFGAYNPELLGLAPTPGEITSDVRRQYFSGERAQKTLDAFDRLLEVSGKSSSDFGPGYNFLRGIADTMRDFKLTSGASQLTETQEGRLLSALDPQLAMTKNKSLSAFGPVARSFAQPFFSGGSLTGFTKGQFGDVRQIRNPSYFAVLLPLLMFGGGVLEFIQNMLQMSAI